MDELAETQRYSRWQLRYAHPYTMGERLSTEAVSHGTLLAVPCGKRILCDITVDDANHYITFAGLVNRNCCVVVELVQHTEFSYRYLFSRLRRLEGSDLPLRMRATSNPGGRGHEWVKNRFLKESSPDRVFIPARLEDNPYLDQAAYIASLSELDPITRAQLLAGDWEAYEGGRFRREWFRSYEYRDGRYYLRGQPEAVISGHCSVFVTVDLAASEKTAADYTVFGAFAVTPRRDLLVLDIRRQRLAVDRIVPDLLTFCQRWKPLWVGVEAAGFQVAIVVQAQQTPGLPPVRGLLPEGKGKLVRATPAIVLAEAGKLYLPDTAPWLEDFVAELVAFTGDDRKDAFDDQIDVVAYATSEMHRAGVHAPSSAPVTPRPVTDGRGRWGIDCEPVNRGSRLFGGK